MEAVDGGLAGIRAKKARDTSMAKAIVPQRAVDSCIHNIIAGIGGNHIVVSGHTLTGIKENRMDTYYHPHDLGKFADMGKGNKNLWDKFMSYYSAVFAEAALTEREKALIALGVAHAVQCPYCIDAYSQACLEKGSNTEEMTEAVHVACAIRGGASLVHGVQMRNVVEKLSM